MQNKRGERKLAGKKQAREWAELDLKAEPEKRFAFEAQWAIRAKGEACPIHFLETFACLLASMVDQV